MGEIRLGLSRQAVLYVSCLLTSFFSLFLFFSFFIVHSLALVRYSKVMVHCARFCNQAVRRLLSALFSFSHFKPAQAFFVHYAEEVCWSDENVS